MRSMPGSFDERGSFDVRPSDGGLRLGDVCSDLSVQGEPTSRESVPKIRFVVTPATISPGETGQLGCPPARQDL
jgi:hypothetical protein